MRSLPADTRSSVKLVLYTDGASRGNPGRSSIGAVLYDEDGAVAETVSEEIGTATNNVAEYSAVIAGLKAAAELGADEVELRSDSLLLVRQISGEYRVKAAGLKPLHAEVQALIAGFAKVEVNHVPREQNEVADALANAALDA